MKLTGLGRVISEDADHEENNIKWANRRKDGIYRIVIIDRVTILVASLTDVCKCLLTNFKILMASPTDKTWVLLNKYICDTVSECFKELNHESKA